MISPTLPFHLAKPRRLVTTGLYAYVQHPSYTANWLVYCANFALLLRLNGSSGCWLPTGLVRALSGPWCAVLVGMAVVIRLGIRIRVREARRF
jgi:protein-S-isoprenylcysteine O-methyltransferase Ste14